MPDDPRDGGGLGAVITLGGSVTIRRLCWDTDSMRCQMSTFPFSAISLTEYGHRLTEVELG